jgi:long-chain fatty acid transport protein
MLIFPEWADASGFSIYDFGAEEQAQGDAVVAQDESPSAVLYNPAGIAGLAGNQLKIGTSILSSRISFHSEATNLDTTIHPGPFFPAYFFVTTEVTEHVGVGFGVFSAIGNKVNYPTDWEGRFFVTSAELLQVNFAPTVAYKINRIFSVGASAVVTYATFQRSNQIPLFPLPAEGTLDVDGDGLGVGGVVGIRADFGSTLLGLVYKSPMSITFDGAARIQLAPFIVGPPARPGIRTEQKFPQMAILGVAHRPIQALTLEADLQWTNWNTFNDQVLHFDQPTGLGQDITVPFNWRDTWTVRAGGHYDVNDFITVRLGYVFDPSAVPDETLSPLIPELNKHIVEGGIGLHKDRWTLDLFVGAIIGESRRANNSLPGMPVHVGTYKASAFGGGLSVQYRF